MLHTENEAKAFVREIAGNAALDRLELLASRLVIENEKQNLVSRSSIPHVWLRHFADSAQLLRFAAAAPAGPWLDLGSGAGFPGLVLSACRPDQDVTLVESRKRRVEWLIEMKEQLALKNCRVIGKTLEKVETMRASIITARAFAPLERLLELANRFAFSETTWLLPKGRTARAEIQAIDHRTPKMFHVEQSLTSDDAGIIVGKGRSRGIL